MYDCYRRMMRHRPARQGGPTLQIGMESRGTVTDLVALAANGRPPSTMASTAQGTYAPASLTPSNTQSGATSPTAPRGAFAPRLADLWGPRPARVAPRRRDGR